MIGILKLGGLTRTTFIKIYSSIQLPQILFQPSRNTTRGGGSHPSQKRIAIRIYRLYLPMVFN